MLGTKLVYNDRLMATIVSPAGKPQVATVRPGTADIKSPKAGKKVEAITINPKPGPGVKQTKVLGYTKVDLKTVPLEQAEVIVSGGRGIGGSEGFQILEQLAELLKGCVGASMVATDNGWVPEERHIGQTGVIVTPRLYIAVGISGSIYHVMGMKDSKVVVAINRDPNAPIFRFADMGIVGDWREVVGATISCLNEAKESS